MAEKAKARPAAKPAAKPEVKTETTTANKAAAAFQRFKAARAEALGNESQAAGPAAGTETPAGGTAPTWPFPPSFSLPQPPEGWLGMLPQPGILQPAPQAVGAIGDRLGSTLRLGIDVINMALAGSLRLLGGFNPGNHYGYYHGHPGHGCTCGGHGHDCGGYDCCCVFEHDPCCTPSVGRCCD